MLYQFKFSNLRPIHPVQFYNEKTKKGVSVNVLSDTGSPLTYLNQNLAKSLGIELGMVEYDMFVKIGNLKPVSTIVRFASGGHDNIIGRYLLNRFKVTYRFDTVIYEELTPTAVATAALAMNERSKRYR